MVYYCVCKPLKIWHITIMYTTQKSLLKAIQNGDDISWNEFYATYRPLMILRGTDLRLSSSELEELNQDVMLYFFKHGKRFRYDRTKGRFRDYLRKVITHTAYDLIRKRRNLELPVEELPEEIDNSMNIRWEVEWRSHLFQQALIVLRSRLEPITYQAFELYALKDEKPENVARFLNLSTSSVYVAKNRAIIKLKEIVRELRENEE